MYVFLLMFSTILVSDLITNLTAVSFKNNLKLLAETINEVLNKNLSVCNPFKIVLFFDIVELSSSKDRKLLYKVNSFSKKNLQGNKIIIAYEHLAEQRLYENLLNGINDEVVVNMYLPTLTLSVTMSVIMDTTKFQFFSI